MSICKKHNTRFLFSCDECNGDKFKEMVENNIKDEKDEFIKNLNEWTMFLEKNPDKINKVIALLFARNKIPVNCGLVDDFLK